MSPRDRATQFFDVLDNYLDARKRLENWDPEVYCRLDRLDRLDQEQDRVRKLKDELEYIYSAIASLKPDGE